MISNTTREVLVKEHFEPPVTSKYSPQKPVLKQHYVFFPLIWYVKAHICLTLTSSSKSKKKVKLSS
jgi:hypothetical protein